MIATYPHPLKWNYINVREVLFSFVFSLRGCVGRESFFKIIPTSNSVEIFLKHVSQLNKLNLLFNFCSVSKLFLSKATDIGLFLCLLVEEVLMRRCHSNFFAPTISLTQIHINAMTQREVIRKKRETGNK